MYVCVERVGCVCMCVRGGWGDVNVHGEGGEGGGGGGGGGNRGRMLIK